MDRKNNSTVVAAAQIPVQESAEENVEKILSYIEKAGRKKVDLVCFPEKCIYMKKESFNPTPSLDRISEACRNGKISAVVGATTQVETKLVNRAFIIDKTGNATYYDKVNLWKAEQEVITAGTQKPPTFRVGNLQASTITCWDMAFPKFVRDVATGIDLLLCPTYLVSYKGFEPALRSIPLTRAFENQLFFVQCDAVTDETMSESVICSPQKILARIVGKEGLITAEIQKEELERINHFLEESEETYLL